VPERRERIGMLLERFGSGSRGAWRGELSRGQLQRLALCRSLLHRPELLILDEPFSGLDAEGAELLDRELAGMRERRTMLVATHDPDASRRSQRRGSLLRSYFADRPCSRARTSPGAAGARHAAAMLLFVLAILVVFHFALPSGSSRLADLGLLWIAILFTRLLGLGRAFVAEREQGLLDGLVLAPVDRSAIWLAKGLATSRSSAVAEVVALPAFALFFEPSAGRPSQASHSPTIGICAVGTLLAAMAAAGRARELLLPLLFLPLALPIVIGGVGASVVDGSGRYLAFLALYDAIFALLAWASFEYVVTE
jgi:heme exporter protein B